MKGLSISVLQKYERVKHFCITKVRKGKAFLSYESMKGLSISVLRKYERVKRFRLTKVRKG